MLKEITTTKIAIFQKKEIRKTIFNNEWWFSVADVIEALTDTVDVRDYIKKMRKRSAILYRVMRNVFLCSSSVSDSLNRYTK